jgi:hypothetical protein
MELALLYLAVELAYCKNSINWHLAEIPGLFRVLSLETPPPSQVVAGTIPGKRRKVFVEMRLIIKMR